MKQVLSISEIESLLGTPFETSPRWSPTQQSPESEEIRRGDSDWHSYSIVSVPPLVDDLVRKIAEHSHEICERLTAHFSPLLQRTFHFQVMSISPCVGNSHAFHASDEEVPFTVRLHAGLELRLFWRKTLVKKVLASLLGDPQADLLKAPTVLETAEQLSEIERGLLTTVNDSIARIMLETIKPSLTHSEDGERPFQNLTLSDSGHDESRLDWVEVRFHWSAPQFSEAMTVFISCNRIVSLDDQPLPPGPPLAIDSTSNLTKLELTATLTSVKLPLKELSHLSIGDILMTDAHIDSKVELKSSNKRLFWGIAGLHAGRKAIRLANTTRETLTGPQQFPLSQIES